MTTFATDHTTIYHHPAQLLQNLISFNTTNPPGNEVECVRYIDNLLTRADIQTDIVALDPARPNLIARLKGQGNASPLLLYGHIDVWSTENQVWQHPPFGGDIADGYVWGRGALDMKGGVAMMVAAFLQAKAEGITLPGDVILTVVSDEEKGGEYGAKYLVAHHTAQFEGVRYAISEFGGFSFYVGKKTFYPIMVAEKMPIGILMTLRGPTGYPTMRYHRGAMAKLGKILERLENARFPVHVTTATKLMVRTMSDALPFPSNVVLKQLLNPIMTDPVLRLLGKQVEQFHPLLHNTVNANALMWADDPTKIPDKIGLQLFCVLLPGSTPEDMIAEIQPIVGEDVELEANYRLYYDPGPSEPNMGLYQILADILRESDPSGVPTPFILPTATDGRIFSRLGVQTYGFLPMNLPQGFDFWRYTHVADERIPVEALAFGSNAIFKLLQRFI